MARCDVIFFPPYADKQKLRDLMKEAWNHQCLLTRKRARSGNSYLTMERVDTRRLQAYQKFMEIFR